MMVSPTIDCAVITNSPEQSSNIFDANIVLSSSVAYDLAYV